MEKRDFLKKLFVICFLIFMTTCSCSAEQSTELQLVQLPIASGASSYFVIDNNNTLYGWGDSYYGAMPQMPYSTNFETKVELMTNAASVYATQWTLLVIDKDRTLWGIGSNGYGRIPGKNSDEPEWEPYKIMEDVVQVCASPVHCIALKTDGTLWGWGDANSLWNHDNKQDILEPFQLCSDVQFVTTSISGTTYFIKKDFSLWMVNGYVNNKNDEESFVGEPLKIGEDVSSVAADTDEVLLLKLDGTLWRTVRHQYWFDYSELEFLLEDVNFCAPDIAIQSDHSLWVWNNNDLSPQNVASNAICGLVEDGNILYITVDGELWEIGDTSVPPENDEDEEVEEEPHRIMSDILVNTYFMPTYMQ